MPKLAKPKSFDYDTITKIIEAQVKSITELRAAKSKTSQEWRFFDASAWATIQAWHCITGGWQKPGDKERLEAILKDH